MEIKIPENVLTIINKINQAGFEAYIVGGCVRDSLLKKEPSDWDITTSAKPEEVKRLFKKTIDTGLQHGTVTVMLDGCGYEVTTYRIDGEYEDARHPKEVIFTASLEEDLKRRDFTINAMAYHPKSGLVDLFQGFEDLQAHIIRCVGSPEQRFTEDALRMMRAVRFAAQLNYEIEPDTFEPIKELAPNIQYVSAERIQVELVKLLVSDHPEKFRLFYETGLTAGFLPEFDVAMRTEQNNPHHCYSVGEHMLRATAEVKNDKVLRLTMLLHDIAKPACISRDEAGIHHFYGHPEKGAKMVEIILQRLKFDNDTIRKTCAYTKYHDHKIECRLACVRRAINKIGDEYFPDLFEVKRADTLAQSTYLREEKLEELEKLQELYRQVISAGQCVCLKDLAVKGQDLIAEGMTPGRKIGEVLHLMLEDVLEQPEHNQKEYLLNHYKEYFT